MPGEIKELKGSQGSRAGRRGKRKTAQSIANLNQIGRENTMIAYTFHSHATFNHRLQFNVEKKALHKTVKNVDSHMLIRGKAMESPIFGGLRFHEYGKRHQITIRIGPIAADRLKQVAETFDMKPATYVKALIYKDLGIFNELLDRRKRRRRRKPVMEDWELHESWER